MKGSQAMKPRADINARFASLSTSHSQPSIHPMSQKFRVLLTTYGSLGDLHPFLSIALELQARGHRPVIATSSLYRPNVENLGIEFHSIAPDMTPPEEWNAASVSAMHSKKGPELFFRYVMMPALRQSYADLLPVMREADITVSQRLIMAAPLCAEVLNKRWLSAALSPVAFGSAADPCYFPGSPLNQKLRANPYSRKILKSWSRMIYSRWVREVARFRAELGLPRGPHPLSEASLSPHGVLALFSRQLAAPQPDWPSNTIQTGTCFHSSAEQNTSSSTLAPEIEAFLEKGEVPVIFTLGSATVYLPGNFYFTAVEAIRTLNKRALLLIGPEANRPANLPQNDEQIAAFEYAPFSKLFERGSVVVHQGGAGTTGQVLQAGLPSLIMPQINDQYDNAMRMQRRGTARMMLHTDCNPQHMAQLLDDLLSNPQYAQSAREIGQRVQQEKGSAAAADAIEQHLATHKA
jgi:rhamnosyltransferase subunit B